MRGSAAMKLEPKEKKVVPLSERGRMMYVHDIQKLFGKDEAGKWIKSQYWILNRFAPARRKKVGRTVYWWENDVIEALDKEEFE